MPSPSPELILASGSESRRQMLEALGFRFRVELPTFEETHLPGIAPGDLAEALALGKARSVARRFEEALVIGADQLLVLEKRLLRKPKDASQAAAQLRELNGKTHLLVTGLAVIGEKSHALRVVHDVTRLTLRHLDGREIDAYVSTGEWVGCLGGYRVEGQGIKLFERIEGDLNSARGLPVLRLCSALRELGVPLFP